MAPILIVAVIPKGTPWAEDGAESGAARGSGLWPPGRASVHGIHTPIDAGESRGGPPLFFAKRRTPNAWGAASASGRTTGRDPEDMRACLGPGLEEPLPPGDNCEVT